MSATEMLPAWLRCDQTRAWGALQAHFDASGRQLDLRQAFVQNPERARALSLQAPHIWADLSKNLWTDHTRQLLADLAEQCQVSQQRDAMFEGAALNNTEGRRVGHVWLRGSPLPADLAERSSVARTQTAMLAYAEQVRANPRIEHVVNIGIGGSDLGAQMATLALSAFATGQRQLHFVSNLDGHELARVLSQCRVDNTLFLIASKTFTTQETMTNAHSARQWFWDQGGTDLAAHFVGLTTHIAAAQAFGIATTFGFDEWVGGRYSLWSAIGLSLAIAVGAEHFKAFLAGAHDMDEHFRLAPTASNLPMQLGLLDVWYRNFHGFSSRSVAPYHALLHRLPAYLQQLEMESNGKHVDRHGQMLSFHTSGVVWGEPGTNGQHAFFQMLHQGTEIIPVEFLACREAAHPWHEHQRLLLTNAVAQAQALMVGAPKVAEHRHFAGNRPSSFLLMDALTPASLGALLALSEHRVFVQGAVWGINSFDQWGVELGKVLAKDVDRRWTQRDYAGLDGSTEQLLRKLAPSKN